MMSPAAAAQNPCFDDTSRIKAVSISYDTDVVAWASEQARFLRAGRFDLLDLEHLAQEIEDVGKSE